MKTLQTFLISTLMLTGLNLHIAIAATPPGESIRPSISLQGSSDSTVKWAAPATFTYKIHVFVPSNGKEANALYRVYPNGKRPRSTACLETDKLYPCFAVTIDQSQYRNAWVQLTLNGDPSTEWAFTKTRGYVAAVADNLDQEAMINVSTQIRFENMVIRIGKIYQGGTIFYIDPTGLHGLVAASYMPSDQSPGIQWWNGYYIPNPGPNGTSVGTGQTNTSAIVAAFGAGSYAASLADSLELNGYNDWFLPSLDELILMYHNIGPGAPYPLTNIGHFSADSNYWSSTESAFQSANYVNFSYELNGFWNLSNQYNKFAVRAVRAF